MSDRISDFRKWIESHPLAPLDLVRIYLGVGLVAKGLHFWQHPELLDSIAKSASLPPLPFSIGACVIAAHLIGGALLVIGLLTRLAALVQVPIFCGAVIYVYAGRTQTFYERQGFEFTVLILFLCALLTIFGAGPWSMDHRLFRKGASRSWLEAHPDLFLDLVRIFLGAALFLKGVFFMQNRVMLTDLIRDAGAWSIVPITAAHYVIPAHLAGGLLLTAGLITRVAALAQLPLLLGAVFYVYLPRIVAIEGRQDLEFAALVLFLVSLVAIFGAGRLSVDHALSKNELAQLQPKPVE